MVLGEYKSDGTINDFAKKATALLKKLFSAKTINDMFGEILKIKV